MLYRKNLHDSGSLGHRRDVLREGQSVVHHHSAFSCMGCWRQRGVHEKNVEIKKGRG